MLVLNKTLYVRDKKYKYYRWTYYPCFMLTVTWICAQYKFFWLTSVFPMILNSFVSIMYYFVELECVDFGLF